MRGIGGNIRESEKLERKLARVIGINGCREGLNGGMSGRGEGAISTLEDVEYFRSVRKENNM